MKFIGVLALLGFSGALADPEKLINIDYLGRGYDIFMGNPQTESVDPGFRQAVVDLTYTVVSSQLSSMYKFTRILKVLFLY